MVSRIYSNRCVLLSTMEGRVDGCLQKRKVDVKVLAFIVRLVVFFWKSVRWPYAEFTVNCEQQQTFPIRLTNENGQVRPMNMFLGSSLYIVVARDRQDILTATSPNSSTTRTCYQWMITLSNHRECKWSCIGFDFVYFLLIFYSQFPWRFGSYYLLGRLSHCFVGLQWLDMSICTVSNTSDLSIPFLTYS